MPASWIGLAASLYGMTRQPSGATQPYIPPNVEGVAQQAQQGITGMQNIASGAAGVTTPMFLDTLNAQRGIDYTPYLGAAQKAGGVYTNLAGMAGNVADIYGGMAGTEAAQQRNLYGAASDIYNTAFDPQSALYARTADLLTNQINAGQALRGLGASGIGAQEYNQAMSNFNIDWQNNLLNRQLQGIQGMGQASNAGYNQGQLAGSDLERMMAAGVQVPSFLLSGAGVPMGAEQYVAGMPAQAAAQYLQNMGGVQNLYGAGVQAAENYITPGAKAINQSADFNAKQNAANWDLFMKSVGTTTPTASNPYGSGIAGYFNTPSTPTIPTTQWT